MPNLDYLTPDQRADVEGMDERSLTWVVSGRVDDRVVISDTDAKSNHPGGDLFVGGDQFAQPARRTAKVGSLISNRYLLEVPAGTKLNRPKVDRQAQPGQPEESDRLYPPSMELPETLDTTEYQPGGTFRFRSQATAAKNVQEPSRAAQGGQPVETPDGGQTAEQQGQPQTPPAAEPTQPKVENARRPGRGE